MKGALLPVLILLGVTSLRAAERKSFDLTTLLGETYHHCRILKVTPVALTVAYDEGVSKVPFELLGDTWRELYHYDPDKARDFAAQEEEKRLKDEAKHKELMREIEEARNLRMDDLVKADHQREAMEAQLAKEQAEAAVKAAAAPPALAPFPGDPTANFFTPSQTIIVIDGSGVSGYPPAWGYTGSGYTYPSYPYNPYIYGPRRVQPPVVITPQPPYRGPGIGMGGGRRMGPGAHYPMR